MIVEIAVPQSGCPKGKLLEVVNIRDDGSITGYEYENQNNWTLYYVPKGEYTRVKNID